MLKRLAATVLLAVPLALATASPAQAQVSVNVLPGCWGVLITVCNVTVGAPVATTTYSYPVCASTCTWVSVPWVYPTSGPACVSYHDHYGWTYSSCV